MNSKWLKGLLVVVPVALLMLGGCGKSGNRTVATVGDYEIKTEELDRYFAQVPMGFTTSQEEYDKRREDRKSVV